MSLKRTVDKCPVCLICGYTGYSSGSGLSNHLKSVHKMKSKDYYDDYIKVEGEDYCKLDSCNKPTKFQSITTGYTSYCCREHSSKDNKWKEQVSNTWKNKTDEECMYIHNKRVEYYIKKGIDPKSKEILGQFKRVYGYDNPSQHPEISERMWNSLRSEDIKRERLNKTRQTCLDRYGVEYTTQVPHIRLKMVKSTNKTMREKGLWQPEENMTPFKKYINRVHSLTKTRSRNKFGKDYLKSVIGKCGDEGKYQVDHIFSIKQGFINNIPPELISHPNNLDLIPWEHNDNKKDRCGITIDELISRTL